MGRPIDPKAVPYVARDGTTTYRVRVRAGGRQTTETFTSESAAAVFIHRCKDPSIGPDRAVELRNREDARNADYVPTVREALEHHVETITGIDQRTRDDYLAVARRTWLPSLGTLRVDEVARADIARWVNASAGTLAPKSIKNAHSILSATLNAATIDGHIAANPARGTRISRAGEEDVEEVRFLTTGEFDRLFAEFAEHDRPVVTWMFGMGTRFGETTAVQVRDVNMSAGRFVGEVWESEPDVRIVRAWKKGGRIGPPKSKAGRRTIILGAVVSDAIEPLLDGRAGSDYLFTTTTGLPIKHANFFNRIWKPATMRASVCVEHRAPTCRCYGAKPYECPIHIKMDDKGVRILPEPCGCPGTLPFRPRIHDARHTHASWLIGQGIRLDVVQDRLGHEDFLTTQRLYGHLLPDARYDAARAASAAFSGTALGGARPLELG